MSLLAPRDLIQAAIEWRAARSAYIQSKTGTAAKYGRLAIAEAELAKATERLEATILEASGNAPLNAGGSHEG